MSDNWIDCSRQVCTSMCIGGCEYPRPRTMTRVRPDVKVALAYLSYYKDPLDLSLPIPSRVLFKAMDDFCTCACTPEEMHYRDCAVRGLFRVVTAELNFDPTDYMVWPGQGGWKMPDYHPLIWVCRPHPDSDEWHQGGPINGPTHFCAQIGMMVVQGE